MNTEENSVEAALSSHEMGQLSASSAGFNASVADHSGRDVKKTAPKILGIISAAIAGIYTFVVHKNRNIISYILGAAYDNDDNFIKKKFDELKNEFSDSGSGRFKEFSRGQKKIHDARDEAMKAAKKAVGGDGGHPHVLRTEAKYSAAAAYYRRVERDHEFAEKIQSILKFKFMDLPASYKRRSIVLSAMAAISVGVVVYTGIKWFTRKPIPSRDEGKNESESHRVNRSRLDNDKSGAAGPGII